MPEREQRYSEAERAGARANARARTAGAKYGQSYANQGLRPVKEQGKHFLYEQGLKQRYGAFANSTWQYEDRGGQLYRKPFANQSGRIAEQGGSAQWEPVPDYVQRAYENPQRRAWNAAHPDAASRPGGGRDQFLFDRYTSGLQIDPATGLRVNRAGELYDPRLFGQQGYTGGAIGQQGMGLDARFYPNAQQSGPQGPMFPAPGMPQTGGGFMAPGSPQGYIPGYAMPWRAPSYQVPGMAPPTGQTGGPFQAPQTPFAPPRAPVYRPLQQPMGFAPGAQIPGAPGVFGQAPRLPQRSPFITPRYQ